MAVVALHHVQLAMPRGQESVAVGFYEGLLGLPRVEKPPHLRTRGGCWFESVSVRVHLGVDGDFKPATKAHPALLVDDPAALRHGLVRRGSRRSTISSSPATSGFTCPIRSGTDSSCSSRWTPRQTDVFR